LHKRKRKKEIEICRRKKYSEGKFAGKIMNNRYLRYKWDTSIINKRARNLHKEAKPSCESHKFVNDSLSHVYCIIYILSATAHNEKKIFFFTEGNIDHN
jgi:hypothetical protein